jgi:hypothetical protein
MIVSGAWSFQTGMLTVGYLIGWSIVAAAFVNVSKGSCISRSLFGCFSARLRASKSTKADD